MKIIDLAKVIGPDCELKEIGIRPGEKIHEVLISKSDAQNTKEYDDYYIVEPQFKWWSTNNNNKVNGKPVPKNFIYSSEMNNQKLSNDQIFNIIDECDY